MTKKFYAHRQRKGEASKCEAVLVPEEPSTECEAAHYVRFVLTSGAALELDVATIEEVTETWADMVCKAVCGLKADGTKVAIPVDKVEYMEEVPC